MPRPRPTRALPVLALLAGCQLAEPQDWSDQLEPEGPCWRVDLLDGLDESSTDELHDLFDCVNQRGAIAPLGPLVDALDAPGRAGLPLGLELAALVNSLASLDLDPFALIPMALDLLQAEPPLVEPLLHIAVELVYGQPWATVAVMPEPAAQQALDDGILSPLLPVLGDTARRVLDEGDASPALLAEILADPALDDLSCTLAGLALATDPEVRAVADPLLADLGDALVRAADGSNDRWSQAGGNSLRDLVVLLLLPPAGGGQGLALDGREALLPILADATAVANLRATLALAREEGRLALLPAQVLYLASVDAAGGGLDGAEDSALVALLRLLDRGNSEVSCSVDLIITQLDIDLGNLSVALLSLLADQDPEAAADGIDLLGELLGLGLTESTLDLIADSGVCPTIDAQMVADLGAIDRLNDPQVGDLLIVLLQALDDLRDGQEDRLPGLVDLLSIAVQAGAVPPLEEALRDLGGTPFAGDLVSAVGLLLEPAALQVDACPSGSRPLELEGLLGLLRAALADRPGGAPVQVAQGVLSEVLDRDETWLAAQRLGQLLQQDEAELRDALPLAASLMALDPELQQLRDLSLLVTDPVLYGPVLRIVEAPEPRAVLATSTEEVEGAVPFLARLVIDGTLDSLLRTVDLVIDGLSSAADPAADAATDSAAPEPD